MRKIVIVISSVFLGIAFLGLCISSSWHSRIEAIGKGTDYKSVEDIVFFVNEPKECVWAHGFGKRYLEGFKLFIYDTTIIWMSYESKEDIKFFKIHSLSREQFEKEHTQMKKEYGRLTDKISKGLWDKDWEKVYMEGLDSGFDTDYIYYIYTYDNEVLIVAKGM
jgi:hypothetical protein